MKMIELNDKKYFELFIGKRVLKSEVFNSEGDIPVYSANVFQPFGYLLSSNITDFSKEYILWGIDGKFEFNYIKKNIVFATTDHCGAIKILDSKILPEYLLYQLELQSHILGYDRSLRPSLTLMKKVSVDVPVDIHNEFDINKQMEIIKRFIKVREINKQISEEILGLNEVSVNINIPSDEIVLKVGDIFDLSISTNQSFFTQDFVNKNKGNIPVFSASKNPDEITYGFVKDQMKEVKYFNDILTWNIDGSVGKTFYREGKFTLSEKVIPLILQKKWENKIDIMYVKYLLETKAVEKGFAYSNKAGKSKIKNIEIEFPSKIVNENKELDIKKQSLLAEEYNQIDKIKKGVLDSLITLNEIKVEL